MSQVCSYYHCDMPRACVCYGWCVGLRACLATWLCDHMHQKEQPLVEPVSKPVVEPAIEPVIEPVSELVEPVAEIQKEPLFKSIQYLSLDTVDEYDATPPTTPHEIIEQLAREHIESMSKVQAELEEMRIKLAKYEEEKKTADRIATIEKQINNLEAEKKAPSQGIIGSQRRTLSVPRVPQRPQNGMKPVEKILKK